MPIPVSVKTRVPYVCKADEGAPNPATFYVSPLTSAEFAVICDENVAASEGGKQIVENDAMARRVLERTLRGWKNWTFPDSDELVPFETKPDGTPSDATLEFLDFNTRVELMQFALGLNGLSETEKGK